MAFRKESLGMKFMAKCNEYQNVMEKLHPISVGSVLNAMILR